MRVAILTTILAGTLVFTASAEDRIVLTELFTATWCSPCPYADSAIDSLAAEMGPESLAVLQYHVADPLANTPEDTARAHWYMGEQINLPYAWFDGLIGVKYASSTSQAYSTYRSHIEDRLSIPSPLRIKSQVSLQDTSGEVSATVRVTETFLDQGLKLYFVLYENEVNGYNYVVRDMLPTEDLSITSPGDSVEVWRSFNIDSSWVREHMGMAVFVQSDTSKQILQAERIDYLLTAVRENVSATRELLYLLRVAPNPFTESVSITFSPPRGLKLAARIYDSSGRLVETLLERSANCDNLFLEWHGRDHNGRRVPPGVYFLQIRSPDEILTKKIVCIR